MDPYKVLGISSDATDAEVKKAYRALAKKYHPDNYVNNPLADLAAEKMKQINEAYDEIQKQRAAGCHPARRREAQAALPMAAAARRAGNISVCAN